MVGLIRSAERMYLGVLHTPPAQQGQGVVDTPVCIGRPISLVPLRCQQWRLAKLQAHVAGARHVPFQVLESHLTYQALSVAGRCL